MALLQMLPPLISIMTVDSTLDPTRTATIMNPAGTDSDVSDRASRRKNAGKGKEARMRPKEANVADKRTMTVTNRVGLEKNADDRVPATTETSTSDGIGTEGQRGCTTAADTQPSSSFMDPCNFNTPSSSGCCQPCHPGCYNCTW